MSVPGGDMEESTIDIMVADAFTTECFSGNPAGVVMDASQLVESQMQKIAREVGASETAFVTGRDVERFTVRFFAPRAEVDFCGHASVAAASALVWSGLFEPAGEVSTLVFASRGGEFPIEIHPHPVCGIEVALDFAKPRFAPFGYSRDLLAGALGMDRYQIPEHWPLSMSQAGVWSLVVPVSSREALDAARPDYESLAKLNEKIGASTTMLYTWQGPVDLYCRCFAPAVGVNEDPVTGTGLAAVAALVVKERALQLNPPLTRLTAEQGTYLGRPGHVKLEVSHGDDGVERVRVLGTAVKVMDGKMRLPAPEA